MGFTESSRYCGNCKRQALVRQETPNHTVHVLITLFSCGLWGIVWLVTTLLASENPWRCTLCGTPTQATRSGSYPSSNKAQPFIGQLSRNTKLAIFIVVVGLLLLTPLAYLIDKPRTSTQQIDTSLENFDVSAPSHVSATPTADPTSYKRGYEAGLEYGKLQGNHPEEGGMPSPEGLKLLASGSAIRNDRTKEDAEWQRGWIAGFKKGFISVRGAGRNEADFENLSWANAYPDVKLYNNDGQHVVTIVSTDPVNGQIKVRYTHDGTVEDKILEAVSNRWFVRKDDPALRQ